MQVEFELATSISNSFAVQKVGGMFDVDVPGIAVSNFSVELPDTKEKWKIGAIVGPSGSGKSSVAKHAYGKAVGTGHKWTHEPVIDVVGKCAIKDRCEMLTRVGFSSPPAWIKPYQVLSTGEKFRADMARLLCSDRKLIVVDEFTSVVDRQVAQFGSAAIAKAVRKTDRQFVAVSCHYDILEWLQPDWILDMGVTRADGHVGEMSRRKLRRPDIKLDIRKCKRATWRLFAKHHYLTASLPGGYYFAACIGDRPIAFCAVAAMFGKPDCRRLSRTVVLPDFQGIGIGSRLSDTIAAMVAADGKRCYATTGHPAMVAYRRASPNWRVKKVYKHGRKRSGISAEKRGLDTRTARARVGFEWVG